MTLPHLTESLGVDSLTLSVEASHVRTSVPPAAAQGLTVNDLDCGPSTQGSLAKFDPSTFSWKTAQCSLLGGLDEFSGTWPRWGMIRFGEFFPLPMPSGLEAHRAWITSVLESGSKAQRLPTLTSFDATAPMLIGKEYDGESRHAMKLMQGIQRLSTPTKSDNRARTPSLNIKFTKTGVSRHLNAEGIESQERLSQQVQRMATPTVQDARGRDRHNQKNGSITLSLLGECRRLPTPQTSDNRDCGNAATSPCITRRRKVGKQLMLSQVAKDRPGNLNPDWIEWFMGWPIKWSALNPLETAKFQQWLRSHGALSVKSTNPKARGE